MSAAVGGGTTTVAVTAVGLMAVVTAANAFGVQVSGGVQFALTGLLVLLLLVSDEPERADNPYWAMRAFSPAEGDGTAWPSGWCPIRDMRS